MQDNTYVNGDWYCTAFIIIFPFNKIKRASSIHSCTNMGMSIQALHWKGANNSYVKISVLYEEVVFYALFEREKRFMKFFHIYPADGRCTFWHLYDSLSNAVPSWLLVSSSALSSAFFLSAKQLLIIQDF